MKIETNMPEEFRIELKALLEKYNVVSAQGFDDGNLYLIRGNNEYWVSFDERPRREAA